MDANDEQISRSILSGIIKGNDALEQWSCEWVCDRANSEFMLQYNCGSSLRERFPKQRIWPEVGTGENFKSIGTDYKKFEGDRPLVRIFGGCRYDLGILEGLGVPSCKNQLRHLIELKKSWDWSAKRNDPERLEKSDLTRLARALYHLGYDRHPVEVQGGVQLRSVFFGAFLYHRPRPPYQGPNLISVDEQESKIETDLEQWWENATVYPDSSKLISETDIRKPEPKFCWARKKGDAAGAICVCLSIDSPA